MTCDDNCSIPKNEDKAGCCAMDSNGFCTRCPGKCHWSHHKNQSFYWEFKTVIEERTLEELKAKYTDATCKESTSQGLIASLQKKYKAIQDELRRNVEAVRKHVNRLGEIATRPNPLSQVDDIDLLIRTEEVERRPGWDSRVRYLAEVRQMAEISTDIAQGGPYTPREWASRTNH
jgi:hypothetical protein